MTKPWSKLKSPIEELFADGLSLAIHCNSFTHKTNHDSYEIPRHWIVLNKEIIWDFPFPFTKSNPARGIVIAGWWEKPHIIGNLLRTYLDCPRDKLFDPFVEDGWELTDILRAADKRLGKDKLLIWGKELDEDHPALKVLLARFKR